MEAGVHIVQNDRTYHFWGACYISGSQNANLTYLGPKLNAHWLVHGNYDIDISEKKQNTQL